jgi:hypothetical protein
MHGNNDRGTGNLCGDGTSECIALLNLIRAEDPWLYLRDRSGERLPLCSDMDPGRGASMNVPGLAGGDWKKYQCESAVKYLLLLHACALDDYPRATDIDGYLSKPGKHDCYPCQKKEQPEEQENRRSGNPWENIFFPAPGIVI